MRVGVAGRAGRVLCLPTLRSILLCIHLVFLTDRMTHMNKLEIGVMLRLFPNKSFMLEHIGIFETRIMKLTVLPLSRSDVKLSLGGLDCPAQAYVARRWQSWDSHSRSPECSVPRGTSSSRSGEASFVSRAGQEQRVWNIPKKEEWSLANGQELPVFRIGG